MRPNGNNRRGNVKTILERTNLVSKIYLSCSMIVFDVAKVYSNHISVIVYRVTDTEQHPFPRYFRSKSALLRLLKYQKSRISNGTRCIFLDQ